MLSVLFTVCGLISAAFAGQDVYAAGTIAEKHDFIYIHPGDTLWAVASEYGPADEDVRDYIVRLKKLNGIKGNGLQAGQKLLLP
ncbi:LysM peptidoglycan-binding domain-containing protein [Paenibacillus sp. KR2-11]